MASSKATETMRDEIMEFFRKSEAALTEAGHKWREALSELVPDDGQSIRKVVDQAFDFTETFVKSQREYANSVLERVLKEKPKPKPAARRGPAKPARHARKPARQTSSA
jgi:hypothetical protein